MFANFERIFEIRKKKNKKINEFFNNFFYQNFKNKNKTFDKFIIRFNIFVVFLKIKKNIKID